jgi:hypothetical protein
MSAMLALLLGWWLVSAWRLGSLYLDQVRQALHKRELDLEHQAERSGATWLGRELIAFLLHEIRSGPAQVIRFALGVLAQARDGQKVALALLEHRDPLVRATAAEMLAQHDSRVKRALRRLLRGERDPGVIVAALEALTQPSNSDLRPELSRFLVSDDPRVRAAAIATGWSVAPDDQLRAMATRLVDGDASARIAALGQLARHPDLLPSALLGRLLCDSEQEVVRQALWAVRRRLDRACLPAAATWLGHPILGHDAQDCLVAFGEVAVPELEQSLYRSAGPQQWTTLAALGRILSARSTDALLAYLSVANAFTAIDRALGALSRHRAAGRPVEPAPLLILLDREILRAISLLQVVAGGEDRSPECSLSLKTVLLHEATLQGGRSRGRILQLLALVGDEPLVRRAQVGLESGDPKQQALALELLDSVLSSDLRQVVSALLEESQSKAERLRHLRDLRPAAFAGDPDICALMARHGGPWAAELIEERMVVPSPSLDLIAHLCRVALFEQVEGEVLTRLALAAAKEQHVRGDSVCHFGEPGDRCYVVVHGTLRVERDGHQLATLGRGALFGEIALLDQSAVRSASVICETPVALYSLTREVFVELLDTHPPLVRGVLAGLAGYVRQQDKVLSAGPCQIALGRGQGECRAQAVGPVSAE